MRPVTEHQPPPCETVMLYRVPDLYPVVGWRSEPTGRWVLEEGGHEDGEHRRYPTIGDDGWEPTHWKPIDHTTLDRLIEEWEAGARKQIRPGESPGPPRG